MRVRIASEPAPGQAVNEDAAIHLGSLVGVFDGVTAPVGIDTGCIHGPAWYVQRLTARLAQVAEAQPAASLSVMLAEAIERVRRDHDGSCDLGNPATPAATVCLLRADDRHAEYLILADCTLVIDGADGVSALTDQRFGDAVARLRREALAKGGSEVPAGTPVPGKYALTNQPDGYWIAAANPEAARQAVTGVLDLHGATRVRRAALLTDGASRAVDDFGLMGWQDLLDILTEDGPTELIRRVREAEDTAKQPRYKRHDDATAVLCTFGSG
ncbi:hypothetical protein [Micromonospora zhanjiangensis]|uniref:Protein phosphatase 2C n=1 Tax=Micromonospora zhanjiangensis TaxID=1522057 RepID=A0ABV8KGF0_9ACTN